MVAAVLLSQHRFGDAIAEANKAMAMDPRDAWNYGAAGDGYMELGDYTRAFEAYDRMGQLQPGPPAYARTSYGLEIKGDLEARSTTCAARPMAPLPTTRNRRPGTMRKSARS